MVGVVDAPEVWARATDRDLQGLSYDDYVSILRGDVSARARSLKRLRGMVRHDHPLLFDVGAGTGEFILLAREHGFEGSGNELSAEAIQYALEHNGIEISPRDLSDQAPESVDVITMWCVLAHVPDPAPFLRAAFAMLRPGGVLFMRTPRYCAIDTIGAALTRLSRGMLVQVSDRRTTPAHMRLYSSRSMAHQLRDVGFAPAGIEPTSHYVFTTEAYLDSTGGRAAQVLRWASSGIDFLIDHGWFIRNTLMVYAQRPM